MKSSVAQTLRKAAALARGGQEKEAKVLYGEVLRRFPANKNAHDAMLALSTPTGGPSPNDLEALIKLYRQGELRHVTEQAAELSQRFPDAVLPHVIAAMALAGLGRHTLALASYDEALRIDPTDADIHSRRGKVLADLNRFTEALASYDEAIHHKPDSGRNYYNRGKVLREMGRLDEALASYERAIALAPDLFDAHNNLANILRDLRRLQEAIVGYDTALRLSPDHPGVLGNRANVLAMLERWHEALASADRAIALAPDLFEVHQLRGFILRELGRPDDALVCYETALRLKPDCAAAAAQKLYLEAQLCDWRAPVHDAELRKIGLEGEVAPPFALLAIEDNPAHHLERAKTWMKAQPPAIPKPVARPAVRPGKLRIGYFSVDFRNHPLMYLMAKLFEVHDRQNFEVHAFAYGNDKQDEMRRRLMAGVDRFHNIDGLSDRGAAEFAQSQGIDIAVDLTGHTRGGRLNIFPHRPAPVQMSYLGYPGSIGTEALDYIVVDKEVVKPDDFVFYCEKTIRLPHCYMVNDDERPISDKVFKRSELGLPETGFVFCCFNSNHKIRPAEFDVWMRLLSRVDGSVLWLLESNRWARANLCREADARGIAADRLVFAPKVPNPEHLARHRCADLFLDNFIYNAHTTACDALWTGLPIVTKPSKSFASRVAASHLLAIDMPELVTYSTDAYEQLAFDLATAPGRLAKVKAKLAANRRTTPLFDTERFARYIEQGYERAYERWFEGLPPDHIDVNAREHLRERLTLN